MTVLRRWQIRCAAAAKDAAGHNIHWTPSELHTAAVESYARFAFAQSWASIRSAPNKMGRQIPIYP